MTLNLDKSAWKRAAIGDVVQNLNVTVKDPSAEGIDRIIAMEHLDPGELKISRWGDLADGTTFTRRVRPGQTLFGKRRAYQRKAAYAEFDAICSGDILVFQADPLKILPEFLPFLVQSNSFYDHALGTSAGSLSPRTNWRDLANYEFELPPLDDQKRVAALMWAIQEAIKDTAAVQHAISRARSTWLDTQVREALDCRSAAFSSVWSQSPESGWSAPPVDEVTGRFVLSLAALGPNGYRTGCLKNVPQTAEVDAKTLSSGDLLISRANTVDMVGRAAIFPEARSDVSFPDTMMRLHLLPEVLPEFAVAVLMSGPGRKHMRRTAAGSATSMVKINRKTLGELVFPVISTDEQRAITNQVNVFDCAVDRRSTEAKRLTDLKSAVGKLVFGGSS
jgi:type I restriction enzyme S subunit